MVSIDKNWTKSYFIRVRSENMYGLSDSGLRPASGFWKPQKPTEKKLVNIQLADF